MDSPLLAMDPYSSPLSMGDFDSCRFDFRIDTKSGLTPSRRKKAERRNCNYNTLFKCKTCGSLFESRPALLEHKVLHNEFRCIFCDEKFDKKLQLQEHLLQKHKSYAKIAPKPMIEMSPPHDDDEIVVYPQSVSPPEIVEEDDDEVIRVPVSLNHSPTSGKGQCAKSPEQRNKLPSPSLPPLVSVASSLDTSSPSLPSSSMIAAAVQNIFKNIGLPEAAPKLDMPQKDVQKASPVKQKEESSPPKPQTEPETPEPQPSHVSPQLVPASVPQQAPALLSPQTPMAQTPMTQTPMAPTPMAQTPMAQTPMAQTPMAQTPMSQAPMFMSPMGAFPQIRYAFPPQMMPFSPATPTAAVPPQSPEVATPQMSAQMSPVNPASGAAPLPPGYVYINVPMYINPNQQTGMPQLIPAMPMPCMQPMVPANTVQPQQQQQQQQQQNTSPAEPTKRPHDETDAPADSTTAPTSSRRKKRRPTPLSEPSLVIQDPRSLSSTDYETVGVSAVKVEPTSPHEINSQALDFSYKQDPVRQDVNISQANSKEDNPLSGTKVMTVCQSPDKEMDFEDDKAAMLDQYRDFSLMGSDQFAFATNQDEAGVSKVDADSTSQSSSTKDDRNTPKDYSCDQCEFKAPNGALLTQHKAKTHKASVKTGLNKLLGKLWQNKMKQPESEPEPEPEEDKPESPGRLTMDLTKDDDDEENEPQPSLAVLPNALTTFTAEMEMMKTMSNFEVRNDPDHTVETKFGMFKFHTCKVCKQLFDNVNDMWEHMGTHKELRKFKCNLCSFKAVCRERLVHHKQQEHPEYVKNPWNKTSKNKDNPNAAQQPAQSGKASHRQQQSPGQGNVPCKASGCSAVFPSNAERQKHTERYHCTLQCPEEGCTQTFLTVGGLKNHQFSHLEENGSTGSNEAQYLCPISNCGKNFVDQASLDAHQSSVHPSNRVLVCPICKFDFKHRSSLNWHMKNKHGCDKIKMAGNKTVYVDSEGQLLLHGEAATRENSLTPTLSPKKIQERVEEVMQHSMPDEHQRFVYNCIDGLPTPGVISYANEPEEIAVDPEGGPLTVDKLALHDRLKEEEDDSDVQPLDMSVKKTHEADDVLSNNSSSLDLSMYSGEVIRTLGAVPSGLNTPARSSCSTPQQKECTLEIDSISSPTEDMQHFTSVLKLKYVGGAAGQAKETKKRQTPVSLPTTSFDCQVCKAPFEDASKMWEHRLGEHPESNRVYCDTCTFSSGTKEELQNHMMSTHGKELGNFKAFICFICGKGYGTKAGLNHHMLRHSENGPPALPCPFPDCHSKLHSKGSLKMHIRRQHNNKNNANQSSAPSTGQAPRVIRCRFSSCTKTFNTTKHLKVHLMQHTGEMPLKCHLCEYACRQRNSMNWHMQSKHSLEKRVSEDGRHTYYV